MHSIQFLNLQAQYGKLEPEISAAVTKTCHESQFINGPEVKEFQKNLAAFTKAHHVIPCGNGTDALQIALMGLGLKPGDEVIMPAFTYIATAEVAALLNIKPVFIDADPDTFNIDPAKIENAITSRTKTILPVHLFGQCAEMETVLQIAQKYGLSIIEDNAQAIGAEYTFSNNLVKQAGTMGDASTTSFFPSKNLGCFGDGGAIFTNETDLAKKLQMIANHGQEKKYYHEVIGVNSRLDTIQAAILNVKLKYLNDFTSARQQAAAFYAEALQDLPEIKTPTRSPNSTHVFHQYTLKVENGKRNALQAFLKGKGVPTMIYYPVPVHLQKAYQYLGYQKGDFPIAEALCEKVLSLPMHTELTIPELEYITDSVRSFFKKNG